MTFRELDAISKGLLAISAFFGVLVPIFLYFMLRWWAVASLILCCRAASKLWNRTNEDKA